MKRHECKWVREYVSEKETEFRCEVCDEYRVVPVHGKAKAHSWDKDRSRNRDSKREH